MAKQETTTSPSTEAQQVYDAVNLGGTVSEVAAAYGLTAEEVFAIVDTINANRSDNRKK